MKGKKYEITLSVISILTVLITTVGVSFAYFTTDISGKAVDVTANTASIGGVTFNGGADFTTSTGEGSVDIEPGWTATKSFSITASPSQVNQTIYVNIDYTNGFQDLKLKVEGTAGEGDSVNGAQGEIILQTNDLGVDTESEDISLVTANLVTIVIPARTTTVTYNYIVTAEFEEKNKPQNYDQGKKFNATLYASLGEDEIFYTDQHPTGTTTKPS